MAIQVPGFLVGFESASADLSSSQFLAVTFASGGVALAGDGVAVDGILQDDPASGTVASVMVEGVSKAVAGGNFAKGALLASDADGKLVTAASGDYIFARALEAGAADRIVTVLISKQGVLPA